MRNSPEVIHISIYYCKKEKNYCSGEGLEGNIQTTQASPPKNYNRHLNKEKEKKKNINVRTIIAGMSYPRLIPSGNNCYIDHYIQVTCGWSGSKLFFISKPNFSVQILLHSTIQIHNLQQKRGNNVTL